MNKCKSDKPDMFSDVLIPAKTVVRLVKSRQYTVKFENLGNPTIIEGLWAIKDAVGFPYVKHWTELVVYYRDKNLTASAPASVIKSLFRYLCVGSEQMFEARFFLGGSANKCLKAAFVSGKQRTFV